MFRYLLLVIVLSICLKGDANLVSWPDDCLNHPHALSGTVSDSEKSDEEATSCTLMFDAIESFVKFNGNATQLNETLKDFCVAMFYDDNVESVLESDKIKCKYERLHHCKEGQWMFRGSCFFLNDEPLTKDDAEEACEGKNGRLVREVAPLQWLIKLNVFDEKPIPLIWLGGRRSQSFRMRRGGLEEYRKAGTVEAVSDEQEKLPSICTTDALQYAYAHKIACKLILTEFKIPSAYHRNACYFLSTNMGMADLPAYEDENDEKNEPISVEHYHETCAVLPNAKAMAVAPSSIVKKDGMRGVIESAVNLYPNSKNDRILIPGQRDTMMPTNPDRSDEYMAEFKFVQPHTNNSYVPIFTNFWVDGYPQETGTDVESTAMELDYENYEELKLKNTPSFVRGRIICSSGMRQEDMENSVCEPTWEASPRDEGAMVCHKAFEMSYYTFDEAIGKCHQFGATLSPIQSYQEQLTVTALAREKVARSDPRSVWIGAKRRDDGDFYWIMDNGSLYYNQWAPKEPNNYDNDEGCIQMYISLDKPGLWNDINCNRKSFDVLGIAAGVCAKYATKPNSTGS